MSVQLESTWTGGKSGKGEIQSDNLQATITIPAIYGGQGSHSNPKELYVASTAACFISTLTAMIEGKKLAIDALRDITHAEVDDDNFSITHTAEVKLSEGVTDQLIEKAKGLVSKADEICTVGNMARKAGVQISAIAKIS